MLRRSTHRLLCALWTRPAAALSTSTSASAWNALFAQPWTNLPAETVAKVQTAIRELDGKVGGGGGGTDDFQA